MTEPIFPSLPGLAFPVTKTPNWSTKIQPSVSGKETRLNYWSYPIYEYSLPYDMLRSDDVNLELQTLIGFFNARYGSYQAFLFDDPDDNTATVQTFGVGDGAKTAFQLSRTVGGATEPVSAPNTITQVRVGGTPTTSYTLNSLTGVITFSSPPSAAAVLDWTGTYYWRCRFLEDQQEVSKFMQSLWETGAVKFRSVK